MTNKTLEKIATENNFKVTYKKYGYWDHCMFFNNTAILFDMIPQKGSESILTDTEKFPPFATKEYIVNAVMANAESLGLRDDTYKPFICGEKKWYKFND